MVRHELLNQRVDMYEASSDAGGGGGDMGRKKAEKRDRESITKHEILTNEDPLLAQKLAEYFDVLEKKCLRRVDDGERLLNGTRWAKEFMSWKLMSRIHRADDLSKKDSDGEGFVDKARDLAKAFIGEKKHHFFVTCIDGRNLPVVMLSHVPHFGGAMRTQAGELFGFMGGMNSGEVVVDRDSFEAQAIEKLLSGRSGETVFYSLDSHIGCAARGKIHKGEGGKAKDDGLLSDIKRKLKISRGISRLAAQLRSEKKNIANIIPQLFSYDPHDGTMYMGLEMHVERAQKEGGFTKALREKLAQEKAIIRTWDLLDDPTIIEELEKANIPEADFRNHFPESMLNNWQAITELHGDGYGKVYLIIYQMISRAYLKGKFTIGNIDDLQEKQISNLAIENKAKVLLKNLVTRWSIARNDKKEDSWPFSKHLEQGVVITESGFGPFEAEEGSEPPDTFAVFSREDLASLLGHVKLAVADLVRPFRQEGRIKDPLAILEGEDFVEAPVVIMNHAILRTLTPESWEKLKQVNFIELFSNEIDWEENRDKLKTWTRTNIERIVVEALQDMKFSAKEHLEIVDGFWELFERIRFMMNEHEFNGWVVDGRVLVMNKLVDNDRRPQVLAPMLF